MRTRKPLVAAITAALMFGLTVQPAFAQSTIEQQREARKKELRGDASAVEKSQEKTSQRKGTTKPADAPRYPQAKRQDPKLATTRAGSEKLRKLVELFTAKDYAGVTQNTDALVAGDATPYEKAFAQRLAGLAAAQQKNAPKAIEYLKAAVDANALDNNPHFDSLSDLAVQYQAAGNNVAALATLDRFLNESGNTDPQYGPMRASLMASTGKGGEAAKIYADAVAKNPNDIQAVRNLAGTYEAMGDFRKTYEVLNDARKRGIATTQEYKVLYSGYLAKEKNWKAALEVLDDGVARNQLPKNPETARGYTVAALDAYSDDQESIALTQLSKAATMSGDGEADLYRAKILAGMGKKAESKAAAQAALSKGVKNTKEAQQLLK